MSAAIKCPRLRRPNYGEIYPSVCGERRMHFGERCAFACRAGFELQGPTLRECLTPGKTEHKRDPVQLLTYTQKIIWQPFSNFPAF
jgi:hypothetical protein